jgi:hypothetical protein
MAPTTRPRKTKFTVERANATLPLVRVITRDLVELSREVSDRQQRLDHLTKGREMDSGDLYDDELRHVRRELENDKRRLEEFAAELGQLGVQLKSAVDGVVDFPSTMEGRAICLCWQMGEPEVLYWHEVNAGFAGRQLLVAGSIVGEDDSAGDTKLKA